MAPRSIFLLVAAISCVLQGVPTEGGSSLNGRKVLLVSMDGFRYDYFKKANTPNFDALIKSGVKVPYVNSTFPPVAFPSHHSIATGLYPESHGIVNNQFFDPVLKKSFTKKSVETKWWNASEPIWINAVKSGLKVGTFFWPGTEVDFNGRRPTAYRPYQEKVPYDERIKTVVDWFTLMDFDLAITYFEEPDRSGHIYGPDDPRLVPVIERMDSTLGIIMLSLEKVGIKDKVDVIVTSDHGMVSLHRPIHAIDFGRLKDITKLVASTLIGVGVPMLLLVPKPNKANELITALSKVDHLNVYLKEAVPKRFHYNNNRRISAVVVYADEGWIITNVILCTLR